MGNHQCWGAPTPHPHMHQCWTQGAEDWATHGTHGAAVVDAGWMVPAWLLLALSCPDWGGSLLLCRVLLVLKVPLVVMVLLVPR